MAQPGPVPPGGGGQGQPASPPGAATTADRLRASVPPPTLRSGTGAWHASQVRTGHYSAAADVPPEGATMPNRPPVLCGAPGCVNVKPCPQHPSKRWTDGGRGSY